MKRVLIVEDDPFTADLYCDKLEAAGYAVDCAESGREAMRRLRAEPPDLVLLDLMVGEVSGVDVIRQLRRQQLTRHLPVIVLTNAFMSDLLTEAWNAGATNCLNKANCSPVRLVEAVRTTLLLEARKDGTDHAIVHGPVPPIQGRHGLIGRHDPEYLLWLRADLVSGLQTRLQDTTSALHAWAGHERETTGAAFQALQSAVHGLAVQAGLVGFVRAARLLTGLEALLDEVRIEPRKLSPSVFRTVEQAVGVLPGLLQETPDDEARMPQPPLVLVVDDEPVAREVVVTALANAHLPTVAAAQAEAALRLCEDNAFHVILLDIDLPGMDGFELCARIHNTPLNMQVPVIFITACDDPEVRERYAHSRGVDFIDKPVMLHELAVKTMTQLERGQFALGN